jgi:glutathione synthase/RimK-type ligase-like ATP-grasp enzyme
MSVFRIKPSGLIACLLWLVYFSALGEPGAPKRIIIFSQSKSGSSIQLEKTYAAYGHEVFSAFLDSSTRIDEKKGFIYFKGRRYSIKDFDLAYFRTWGKAKARDLAYAWQSAFERHGVPCVDPLRAKHYANNRYDMMQLFYTNRIPTPKTLIVRVGTPVDTCLSMIKQNFDHMVVIKGEGSGGRNHSFINVDDEQKLREVLLTNYLVGARVDSKPLVLQQYISSKNKAGFSYHYRILIVGGEIIWTMRFTASSKQTYASNLALGANAEMVKIDAVFSAEQQGEIIRACNLMGVNIAGVDATVVNGTLYIFEVNDSPSLSFPPYSLPKSFIEKIVSYSIERLARVK